MITPFCRTPHEDRERVTAMASKDDGASPQPVAETDTSPRVQRSASYSEAIGPQAHEPPAQKGGDAVVAAETRSISRAAFVRGIAGMFVYYLMYAGAEHTPGDWISAYIEKQLNGTDADAMGLALDQSINVTTYQSIVEEHLIQQGAFVTSTYWGCLTFGRLAGVPLSWYLNDTKLLAGDMIVCILGVVLLFAWGSSALDGIYASAVLLGAGLSTMLVASVSLFPRQHFRVPPYLM